MSTWTASPQGQQVIKSTWTASPQGHKVTTPTPLCVYSWTAWLVNHTVTVLQGTVSPLCPWCPPSPPPFINYTVTVSPHWPLILWYRMFTWTIDTCCLKVHKSTRYCFSLWPCVTPFPTLPHYYKSSTPKREGEQRDRQSVRTAV